MVIDYQGRLLAADEIATLTRTACRLRIELGAALDPILFALLTRRRAA